VKKQIETERTSTLILTDTPDGKPLAIVTLHDVLRAQVAMSDREG